jgi:hypothetical protein
MTVVSISRCNGKTDRLLASGFEESANGRPPQWIREAGQQLDEAIKAYGDVPADRQVLLEGLIERLELALERLARIMANQPTRPHPPIKRLSPVDQP